nr:MAG TPA: hypothetical protein [Caudoviricetes sp.]
MTLFPRQVTGPVEDSIRGWGPRISTASGKVSGRGQPYAKRPNQTGY